MPYTLASASTFNLYMLNPPYTCNVSPYRHTPNDVVFRANIQKKPYDQVGLSAFGNA